MSAPAAKARSEPVSTMQPMPGSASAAVAAAITSAVSCALMAFNAFGRLRVTRRTRPRVSVRIVS